jgi:hypothetical protein
MKIFFAVLSGLIMIQNLSGYETIPGLTRGTPGPVLVPDPGRPTVTITASDRGPVLFVEDPGYPIFGPATKPDSNWWYTLTRIFGTGNFDWFGPTTDPNQDGPSLPVMQNHELVIWNIYDYWWGSGQGYPPGLTPVDQANIENYLAGGGKVWLIGQDLILSGVPRAWLTTNFHMASADTDYWNGALCPVQDHIKNPDLFVTFYADYQANGFWPDALTPDSQSGPVLSDEERIRTIGQGYPLARPLTASFWTIDGRQPDPGLSWEYIVRKILDAFGLPVITVDVGTESISIPGVVFENTVLYPRATVINYGTDSASFPVYCRIEPGGYYSQVNVTLAPDSLRQITFPDSFLFADGFYNVTVYTSAVGDLYPRNDTLVTQVDATNWLYYDDGTVGNFWAWNTGNNGWGVRFPLSNDCYADSIAIYIGDSTWPLPGGDTATFRIYAGAGRPDTLRQELRRVWVDRGAWNIYALDTIMNIFPAGGDIFLFYVQVGDLPDCPALAYDRVVDHPGYMWQLYNDSFSVALPGGDWMLRVHVRPFIGITENTEKIPAPLSFQALGVSGPLTQVGFNLEKSMDVDLRVFDIVGRLRQILIQGWFAAGSHRRRVRIDQPAGVYFFSFRTGDGRVHIQKFVLIR